MPERDGISEARVIGSPGNAATNFPYANSNAVDVLRIAADRASWP